jgi:hypothetical protein
MYVIAKVKRIASNYLYVHQYTGIYRKPRIYEMID